MNILTICDSGDILKVVRFVKIIITIIKIVVPIILIISSMIMFIGEMTNGKDDLVSSGLKKFLSKIIAAILIFLIPTFIVTIANIASADTSELAKCSQNATKEGISAAYLKEATKLVKLAEETLSRGDFSAARTKTLKLDETPKKGELMKKLKKIEEKIIEKEKESMKIESGWWWPVGSKETTTVGGKTFATGSPSATGITAYFAGNDSVHQGLGGGHGAIDIGVSRKSNIIASRSGTVIKPTTNERIDYPEQAIRPDSNGKYNCSGLVANTVRIDHGNGMVTIYSHLYMNTITVRAGDHVEQGQVIGLSGSSGCSTGPHLHFQMELNGTRVDPLNYVSNSNPRP